MLDKRTLELLRVEPGTKVKLKDRDAGWTVTPEMRELSKDELKTRSHEYLERSRKEIGDAQTHLYADDRYSVLMILQAMDTAGKDGTIKHVMSGVNPQGCQVFSFKKPSAEELDHTFLWRYTRALPERGRIGIFNRSYYEDVLIVKVHPELLGPTPGHAKINEKFWNARYQDINHLEQHLVRNGTIVLKFFLHLSKKEQKNRLLERIDNPEKNWKFSPADLAERGFWKQYMSAYEDTLSRTSTEWAPWHIVPADHKWVARAIVGEVLVQTLARLDLRYPPTTKAQRAEMARARRRLVNEA